MSIRGNTRIEPLLLLLAIIVAENADVLSSAAATAVASFKLFLISKLPLVMCAPCPATTGRGPEPRLSMNPVRFRPDQLSSDAEPARAVRLPIRVLTG